MKPTREKLKKLMVTHHGNLSAIARALGMTRQGVAWYLDRFDLNDEAINERAMAGIAGPRSNLPFGSVDHIGERAGILDVLARSVNYSAARKELKISRRTFFRKLRALGITPAKVLAHRRSLQAAASRRTA